VRLAMRATWRWSAGSRRIVRVEDFMSCIVIRPTPSYKRMQTDRGPTSLWSAPRWTAERAAAELRH
jgi:hypothetical protein